MIIEGYRCPQEQRNHGYPNDDNRCRKGEGGHSFPILADIVFEKSLFCGGLDRDVFCNEMLAFDWYLSKKGTSYKFSSGPAVLFRTSLEGQIDNTFWTEHDSQGSHISVIIIFSQ